MAHAGLAKPLRLAVMAVSAASLLGSAQAAVYTGNWDPAYGAPFPNLGWRGEATFVIPDSCGTPAVLSVFACPGMALLDATVEFYDTTIAGPAPALATLLWPVAAGPNPPAPLFQATFLGGMLSSVWSGYLGPGLVPATGFAGINNYEFHLEFLPTGARLTHYQSGLESSLTVQQCAMAAEGTEYEKYCGFSSSNGEGVQMTFALAAVAAIPEPQTYALMLAGLAAAGMASRRRGRR